MKRLNALAMLGCTLLFFSLSAWSQDITVGELTYSLEGSEATVTGRAEGSTVTDIIIPNSVLYESIPYDVVTIGEAAFDNDQLTSVTMPDSVTTIELGAFYRNRLTSVTITGNVTWIGALAFASNRLTSVTIPANVTTIQGLAFALNYIRIDSLNSYTLESLVFNGDYVPWEDEQEEGVLNSFGYFGTGISPYIFIGPTAIYPSGNRTSVSACPSQSWDGIQFEVDLDLFVTVEQTPEACVDPVDPVALVAALSAFIENLNVKKGIANSLDAKLGAVQGALSDLNENNDVAALNAIYAFCYNAQAQSGKQLEEADVDQLVSKADAIITVIDPTASLCSE